MKKHIILASCLFAAIGLCGSIQAQSVTDTVKVSRTTSQATNHEDFKTGDLYYYGEGVDQNYATAVKYYRKAADDGNAYAQYKLGTCYWYGLGVSRNEAEAKKWFQKAADQGHADAKQFLTISGR